MCCCLSCSCSTPSKLYSLQIVKEAGDEGTTYYHFMYLYVFFFFLILVLHNFFISLFSVRGLITFSFVLCVHLTLFVNTLALWYGLKQCWFSIWACPLKVIPFVTSILEPIVRISICNEDYSFLRILPTTWEIGACSLNIYTHRS